MENGTENNELLQLLRLMLINHLECREEEESSKCNPSIYSELPLSQTKSEDKQLQLH